MKSKAVRGLTKAGKRRGRPPKYLTAEQLANPAPSPEPVQDEDASLSYRSDTPFIIRMILAKHRAPLRSKEDLAIRLDAEDESSGHSAQEVAAMAARIRRVSGDGVDKMPAPIRRQRRISRKS